MATRYCASCASLNVAALMSRAGCYHHTSISTRPCWSEVFALWPQSLLYPHTHHPSSRCARDTTAVLCFHANLAQYSHPRGYRYHTRSWKPEQYGVRGNHQWWLYGCTRCAFRSQPVRSWRERRNVGKQNASCDYRRHWSGHLRQSYRVRSTPRGMVTELTDSRLSKENMVLRAHIDPRLVYVIPNAVVASNFLPDPTQAPNVKDKSMVTHLRCLELPLTVHASPNHVC